MKLISEELELEVLNCNTIENYDECIYGEIYYYTEKTNLKENALYLITENISKLLPRSSAYIFYGKKVPEFKSDIMCYSFAEKSLSVMELLNKILEIFSKYRKWNLSLQAALEDENLQSMADCSEEIFHNEIAIVDASYRQLVKRKKVNYPRNVLPMDILNFFKNDKEFNLARSKTTVFKYPASIYPVPCWCLNIFYQKEYYCRIVIFEYEKISSSITWLLNVLGEYVKKYIQIKNQENESSYLYLGDYLRKVIFGEEFSLEEFKRCLSSFGWFPNSKYIMGYIILSKGDFINKTTSYYCRELTKEYPALCAFAVKENIVIVVDCGFYNNSVSDFFVNFSYTLRESNFRIGYSDVFNDFSALKYYYLQAQTAVLLGLENDETIWSHKFSDYALTFIIQEATRKLPRKYLCAEELKILDKYDKKNGTNYLVTLKQYLELNQNAVQTAKALYIHPATMVYRLKRLKELIDINFSDSERILYIKLSFSLLDTE